MVSYGRRWIAAGAVAWVSLVSTPAWAEDAEIYRWGVVPQFTSYVTHANWTPVLDELARRTGLKFSLVTYDGFKPFMQDLKQGSNEFAYINPYHMLIGHEKQGYIPLLRDSKRKLSGVLVVRADSNLRSLADLNHSKIAFPAPSAFGASLYLRALLTKEKVAFEPVYVGTHSNAYRAALRGSSAAGGGVLRTLEREPDAIRNRLRILYKTPGVPAHPVVAHPRVPEAVREKVALALQALSREEQGQALLVRIQLPQPVRASYARDYQSLSQLHLENLLKH